MCIYIHIHITYMCIHTTILNVSVTCSYNSTVFGSVNAVFETGDKR